MPAHRLPVVVLARLAVDHRDEGGALGAGLLRDAMLRTLGAADSIGGRTLVPARDASAAAFYATHGFGASPTDPLHRVLLLKGRAGSLGE